FSTYDTSRAITRSSGAFSRHIGFTDSPHASLGTDTRPRHREVYRTIFARSFTRLLRPAGNNLRRSNLVGRDLPQRLGTFCIRRSPCARGNRNVFAKIFCAAKFGSETRRGGT